MKVVMLKNVANFNDSLSLGCDPTKVKVLFKCSIRYQQKTSFLENCSLFFYCFYLKVSNPTSFIQFR